MNKKWIKAVLILAIVGSLAWFLRVPAFWMPFRNISLTHSLALIGLGLASFIISGARYYQVARTMSPQVISKWDILTLPPAMNLWGFIIPAKGGMIYSLFYFRARYRIALSKGTSVSLFNYLVSLGSLGLFGVLYVGFIQFVPEVLIASIVLLLPVPLLLVVPPTAYSRVKVQVLQRVLRFLANTHEQLKTVCADRTLVLVNTALSCASTLVYLLWFYVGAQALGFHTIGLTEIFLLQLVTYIGTIFRFTPGNLGLNEVFSGLAMGLAGGAMEVGVQISLVIRFAALVITLSIGLATAISHLQYYKVDSFKGLRTRLLSRQPE